MQSEPTELVSLAWLSATGRMPMCLSFRAGEQHSFLTHSLLMNDFLYVDGQHNCIQSMAEVACLSKLVASSDLGRASATQAGSLARRATDPPFEICKRMQPPDWMVAFAVMAG